MWYISYFSGVMYVACLYWKCRYTPITCDDLQIHVGGLDNFLQVGKRLVSRENFSGCMENVWFNYMDVIKDARMQQPRFTVHGNVLFGFCRVSSWLQSDVTAFSGPFSSCSCFSCCSSSCLFPSVLMALPVSLSFRLNGHFSRWTWLSRYQNVSILGFIGTKGDGGGCDIWS